MQFSFFSHVRSMGNEPAITGWICVWQTEGERRDRTLSKTFERLLETVTCYVTIPHGFWATKKVYTTLTSIYFFSSRSCLVSKCEGISCKLIPITVRDQLDISRDCLHDDASSVVGLRGIPETLFFVWCSNSFYVAAELHWTPPRPVAKQIFLKGCRAGLGARGFRGFKSNLFLSMLLKTAAVFNFMYCLSKRRHSFSYTPESPQRRVRQWHWLIEQVHLLTTGVQRNWT